MVIKAEMQRLLELEENVIDDTTGWTYNTASWGMAKDYGSITIPRNSLVIWRYYVSTETNANQLRFLFGSYLYIDNDVSAGEHIGVAYLPAGTWDFEVHGKSSGSITVNSFKVGYVKFNDEQGISIRTYSSSLAVQVRDRKTPIGNLKNAAFFVVCHAITAGAQTNFEDVGDSLTNGVSLDVDGDQIDWTDRNQDTGSGNGAYAFYHASLAAGESHTFEISKDNANTVVTISIYACPWLLIAADNEPVTLSFPQNSTLYVMIEPLNSDASNKNITLGKFRAISFGDSTDYYTTDADTGIFVFSYTFEIVPPSVRLYLNGLGGCISAVAVDTS